MTKVSPLEDYQCMLCSAYSGVTSKGTCSEIKGHSEQCSPIVFAMRQ